MGLRALITCGVCTMEMQPDKASTPKTHSAMTGPNTPETPRCAALHGKKHRVIISDKPTMALLDVFPAREQASGLLQQKESNRRSDDPVTDEQ